MGFLDRFRRSAAVPDDLLERTLLVPTPDTPEEHRGPEILQADQEFSFVLVQDREGLPVLPAFTSEEALLRWNPQAGGFALTRSEARKLLGAVPYSVPAGSSVRIGAPGQPPPEGFVDALRDACDREAMVAEAYLFQLQVVEQNDKPYMTIGLGLRSPVEHGDAARIAESIGAEVNPQSWGYEFVDIIALDGDMLEKVRSAVPAIFPRG